MADIGLCEAPIEGEAARDRQRGWGSSTEGGGSELSLPSSQKVWGPLGERPRCGGMRVCLHCSCSAKLVCSSHGT